MKQNETAVGLTLILSVTGIKAGKIIRYSTKHLVRQPTFYNNPF